MHARNRHGNAQAETRELVLLREWFGMYGTNSRPGLLLAKVCKMLRVCHSKTLLIFLGIKKRGMSFKVPLLSLVKKIRVALPSI